MGYIFEVGQLANNENFHSSMSSVLQKSTAKLALIHDGDIIDLLQDSLDVRIHNYNSWIQQLAPPVYLHGDGMTFVRVKNYEYSLIFEIFSWNVCRHV